MQRFTKFVFSFSHYCFFYKAVIYKILLAVNFVVERKIKDCFKKQNTEEKRKAVTIKKKKTWYKEIETWREGEIYIKVTVYVWDLFIFTYRIQAVMYIYAELAMESVKLHNTLLL